MSASHDIRQAEQNFSHMCFDTTYEWAACPYSTTSSTVDVFPFILYENQRAPVHPLYTPSSAPLLPKRIRRRDPNHIPRPRNAFIIFRSIYVASPYSVNGEEQQNELSKQAAQVWASLTEEQKRSFRVLAQKEKEEHRHRYPDFNYSPKGCSKPRKAKAPIPGESTMWAWSSSPPSPTPSSVHSAPRLPQSGSSHTSYATTYYEESMDCQNEIKYSDSEAFLPDPPAFHPTFTGNHAHDVLQHSPLYSSHFYMPNYPYLAAVDEHEPSFSDNFLSIVDNMNFTQRDPSSTPYDPYHFCPATLDTHQSNAFFYSSLQSHTQSLC